MQDLLVVARGLPRSQDQDRSQAACIGSTRWTIREDPQLPFLIPEMTVYAVSLCVESFVGTA